MDEVEVIRHPCTGRTAGGHASWIEVEVSVPSAGVLAVFRPSEDEIAAGHADLVADHLMRQARAFQAQLVELRSAFRNARDVPRAPLMLRPLLAPVTLEGGRRTLKPSLERAGIMMAVAAAGGIAGAELAPGTAFAIGSAAASAILIAYALLGTRFAARLDEQFDRTAGLEVPILPAGRLQRPAESSGTRFRGPYTVGPRIIVHSSGASIATSAQVQVSDGSGQQVELLTSAPPDDDIDAATLAAVMLRQADELVAQLEYQEQLAGRLAGAE